MSSPDRTVRRRRPAVAAFLALVATVGLGACSDVRPLYGSLGNGPSVGAKLDQVDIDLGDSRVGQRVRNELLFAFHGGGEEPTKPVWRLKMRLTDSSLPVGIERLEATPAAYLVQLNASFTLVEIATDKTVLTGTSFANASYDFSQQRFANVRAQRDAENRAANQIAIDIRTKIAAFMAKSS